MILRSKQIGVRVFSAPRQFMLLFLVICERRSCTLQIKIQTFDVGVYLLDLLTILVSVKHDTSHWTVSPCPRCLFIHTILRLLSLLSFAIRSVPVSHVSCLTRVSLPWRVPYGRLNVSGYQHDTHRHESRYYSRTIGISPPSPLPCDLDTNHQ